jgi:GC-rich sequence DNA-binding factor
VLNIKYLEDKLIKIKSDMTKKLMDRRREDVRDQMKELSQQQQQVQQSAANADAIEEAARQRRSAERDGRRRRRLQHRTASQKSIKVQHFDGMSSDDEISSLDQSNLGKSRAEVESQARQIMADVVEDFSTFEVCTLI